MMRRPATTRLASALGWVPLVKGGRFVAALGVHQHAPRGWTPEEVALVEETAERTWAALERARAEEALRESEEKYHTESGCILPGMNEKRDSQQESESSRLEGLYRKASDAVLRTHLLMVWRISLGDSVEEVARMVGYSGKWVREIQRRYESGGVDALGDRRHGNPGAKERALLDETGEEELVEALSGAPPGGGMWSGPKVARWIKERNGLEKVHVQRGFEYLRKVGMSPQVPRPSNAKGADPSEREAFKKVSR
jgi:transposase